MLAVADVVLNRVERSGNPICAVVRAKGQFHGHGYRAGADVVALARRALAGEGRGVTAGALYFTAAWDRPRWTRRLRVTVQVGGNRFYAGKRKP
jgi:spore germination cell wall hydrolase CwlJ-like protein